MAPIAVAGWGVLFWPPTLDDAVPLQSGMRTMAVMDDRRSFGGLLRHYRRVVGLTQEQLAAHAGLSARAITDLERGVRRFPYPDTIARLSDALRLDTTERAALQSAGRRGRRNAESDTPRSDDPSQYLPTPLTSFIGRELEIARIRQVIETARLVTLIGVGGVGKTRLAVQVAAQMLDTFEDGVFFVDLAPFRDPAYVVSSIASVLGVRHAGGQRLLDALELALRRKSVLLLLDNFEQVRDAGRDVAALLRVCPHLHVLVTSRAALRISGEHEIPVLPLGLPLAPAGQVANAVVQSEGGRMFLERARAVRPDLPLTEETAAAIVNICRRLDGLPLAIELAAARVRMLPPQALVARMEPRLPWLVGGGHDLPARQQTLESTIAWSYDLLSADEQALLRRLSVFAEGFTLDAAEAVCTYDNDIQRRTAECMEALLANSLLWTAASDGDPRFGMLETIREYAHHQLVASGDEPVVLQMYAAYYCVLLREAEQLHSARELPGAWLQSLDFELNNLRVALDWTLRVQDTRAALELGAGLWAFWANRGLYAEGRSWLARMLALPGASEPTLQRSRILVGAGLLAHQQSDHAAAHALYSEGLAAARAVNDTVTIVRALNNLAVVSADRADFAAARTLAKEGLKIATVEGERGREALLLTNLGTTAYAEGDLAEAHSLAKASLDLAEEIGYPPHIARALGLLGQIAFAQGDHNAAELLLERSLVRWRERGTRYMIARVLADLGRVATAQGEQDRAHSLLVKGIRELQSIGDTTSIIRSLEYFAELAARQARAEHAVLLFAAASRLRDGLGTPMWPVERDLLEHSIVSTRAILGDRAAAIWRAGRRMSLGEAIDLAESSS